MQIVRNQNIVTVVYNEERQTAKLSYNDQTLEVSEDFISDLSVIYKASFLDIFKIIVDAGPTLFDGKVFIGFGKVEGGLHQENGYYHALYALPEYNEGKIHKVFIERKLFREVL